MNHQAALHEALESLLRDERLAPCWAPLVAHIRRIPESDEEDFADAVHEVARGAALRGEPHISDLFSMLDVGFRRLSESYGGDETARRLEGLAVTALRCAGIGYAAGLEQRLAILEALIAEASPVDPDTGVLRPRDLGRHLSLEINRCQRMQLPMGVAAVFDADGETEPPAGSRAPAVGHVLRENLRRYDDVGRLETGEFMAVLPDVSRNGLGSVAERLHSRLSEDPRTADAQRHMALTHLDCVDVTVGDLMEQVTDALQRARSGDDYISWA